MASLEDFKKFYQDNPRYFEIAGEGISHGTLFPSHRQVHAYVRNLQGKQICDFGCGSGNDIEHMYSLQNEYVGLDVSASALEGARRRFSPQNVSYVAIDFERPLSFPDESFDVITSFFVFEHVLEPTKTLNELIRILRSGGELLLITPNYGSPLKSAPPLGAPSKGKLILKILRITKTMLRRTIHPRASLDLTLVPMEKIDVSATWEPDMDATSEPWSWEISRYMEARGFNVSAKTWEGELKTGPERMLARVQTWPIVKHFGPLCFIHAVKRKS